MKKHVTHYPCNLAGNSVHVDLLFLRKEMPQLAALFSHRVVDVSAVSELCFRCACGWCALQPSCHHLWC